METGNRNLERYALDLETGSTRATVDLRREDVEPLALATTDTVAERVVRERVEILVLADHEGAPGSSMERMEDLGEFLRLFVIALEIHQDAEPRFVVDQASVAFVRLDHENRSTPRPGVPELTVLP